MTLIEIMIVIAILALVATGAVMGLGALTRTHVRSACMHVMAAAHYAYNRAVVQHETVRVVLDLGSGKLSLEEASGQVTLTRNDDPRRKLSEKDGEDASAVDPWEAARNRLSKTIRPTFGASPFGPIRGPSGSTLARFQPHSLGGGVHILRVYVPHEPDPVEHGKASIYFFPNGRTEHAVVQLGDGDHVVYSVEINDLTGRAKVYDRAYEPKPIEEDTGLEDPS